MSQPQSSDRAAQPLYQKEAKIYPRETTGRYSRLRRLAAWLLLGLFYGVVWMRVGGEPLILFDLPARQFHLFTLTFWPQDFIYLALLLVTAGLTLFFVTAVAGRLWCGFACPQTVWTEAFLMMERWTEGNRRARMKLDQAPWSANKVLRKTAKQLLWISFALWTGVTFVGYFSPIDQLMVDLFSASSGAWETFWVLFYAAATYMNAGYLREQVCKYMCPYARFQSAMFDRDTLIISYDRARGEPRGSRKRGVPRETLAVGDCIDCHQCVQVCPTGIDIRQGLQYECIACAACVDVCDQVMDRMDYPKGLIRYTTERQLEAPAETRGALAHLIRPRTLVYASLLIGLITFIGISMMNRVPLRMELIRDRNALYRPLGDDRIENVYTMKVLNMSDQSRRYRLSVEPAALFRIDRPSEIEVDAGQSSAIVVEIVADRDAGQGGKAITLTLTDEAQVEVSVQRDSRFFFPIEARPVTTTAGSAPHSGDAP